MLGSCSKAQPLLSDSHGSGAAQHSTAQHSTAQHSTAAAQRQPWLSHSTARHTTIEHSTAQHGTRVCLLGKMLLWAAVRIATRLMLLVLEFGAGSLAAHATACILA